MRKLICCTNFKSDHYTIRHAEAGVVHETFGHILAMSFEHSLRNQEYLARIGCNENVHLWTLEKTDSGKFHIINCATG